jgi:hypothetical protein
MDGNVCKCPDASFGEQWSNGSGVDVSDGYYPVITNSTHFHPEKNEYTSFGSNPSEIYIIKLSNDSC